MDAFPVPGVAGNRRCGLIACAGGAGCPARIAGLHASPVPCSNPVTRIQPVFAASNPSGVRH
jgi:hypothetical protein